MDNRDIDRQIAEKVMGWHLSCLEGFWKNRCGVEIYTNPEKAVGETLLNPWQPSTNIAHAFELAKKMQESRQFLYLVDSSGDYWNAEFFNATGENHSHKADTAEMAICLAALEAVKGK